MYGLVLYAACAHNFGHFLCIVPSHKLLILLEMYEKMKDIHKKGETKHTYSQGTSTKAKPERSEVHEKKRSSVKKWQTQ